MDIRCENDIKFGELNDGVLEFKCRSTRCGHAPGVVVIHRFDAMTGRQIDTQRFRDPAGVVKERSKANGSEHSPDSVRSA